MQVMAGVEVFRSPDSRQQPPMREHSIQVLRQLEQQEVGKVCLDSLHRCRAVWRFLNNKAARLKVDTNQLPYVRIVVDYQRLVTLMVHDILFPQSSTSWTSRVSSWMLTGLINTLRRFL